MTAYPLDKMLIPLKAKRAKVNALVGTPKPYSEAALRKAYGHSKKGKK